MINSLAEKKVYIAIADPWDFVTTNGEHRTGTIVASAVPLLDSLEICLDKSVESLGVLTNKVFAHPRHADHSLVNLSVGMLVPCNFTYEGIAFIGALKLASVD
jgi:hypothetical protein